MAKFIFEAILTPEEEGGYSATVPALPGCFSDGETYRETIFMIADAMKTWIASALHHGEVIPPPIGEKRCRRAASVLSFSSKPMKHTSWKVPSCQPLLPHVNWAYPQVV